MTRTLKAEVVVPAQCELAEGPVWDAARGLLRWVDILPGHVHALDPGTGAHTWFEAGDPVGTVGLTRDGGLVLALVDGFARSGPDGEDLRRLPGFSVDRSVVRFNDGKPDPWGNLCAGTMAAAGASDPPCALYRLSPGGAVTELLGGVGLSNGLDWSDDHRAFFYADSLAGGVDVFDTDPDTGALSGRRRFVSVQGLPDGLTLDAEGCLWLAVWGTGELHRYTPQGRLDTVVRLPVSQVTSAAFGGAGLDTLYITTAREDFTPADLAAQPQAGDIFAVTPGVTGRPPFLFGALSRAARLPSAPVASRSPLTSLLDRYRPADDTERADVDQVRALLETAADPYRRDLPLHVTASAVIVHPPTARVLLRWHQRQQAWLQVGGHGDPGEADPLAIAGREAAEEAGLPDLVPWPDAAVRHVVLVDVPPGRGEPAHRHADVRFFLATGVPDAIRPESPAAALRWLSLPAARDLTSEPNLRATLSRLERFLPRH